MTDTVGNYYVGEGMAPANWQFTEYTGPCANQSANATTVLNQVTGLNCVGGQVGTGNDVITPSTLSSSNPPATVSIEGKGFATTYGKPRVEYYYNDGTYVGAVTATTATSTSISAPPISGLSSDPTGVYVGLIQNATSGGGWTTIGSVALNLVTPTAPNIGSKTTGKCVNGVCSNGEN